MIDTSQIEFTYDNKTILSFPDIQCKEGETLLIIGKSGVGKSTILHLLGGLMKPTNGSVLIDGKNIADMKGSELDHFRGKNIGIIFQKNHFVRSLNVMDNLILAQYLASGKSNRSEAEELLQSLKLSHKANSGIREISEGEKQRISIARALINQPRLILADEPTSALDDDNCDGVFNLLKSQAQKVNASLVIVTHDQRLKDKVSNKIELS